MTNPVNDNGKSASQIRKTQVIKDIKALDRKGNYTGAQKLYKKNFP